MFQNFEKYEFIYRPTTLLQMNSSFLITLENQKRVQNPVKHLRQSVLQEYLLALNR